MSKRIITLDYLRGFSMIMIMVFHIILTAWDTANAVRSGSIDPFTLNPVLIVIMLIVLIFGYWRGFFLIISAIANVYAISKGLHKGKSRGKILLKQVLSGLVLIVWGTIVELFFNEWGMIRKWADTGNLEVRITDIYNAEALVNIGWAVIFAGLVLYILSANDGIRKTKRNALVFAILALLVLIITPLVHNLANTLYGGNFQDWSSLPPGEDSFSLGRLLISWFVHAESPTLPALAYSFAGCSIGVFMASQKPSRKILRNSAIAGLVIFVIGAIFTVMEVMNALNSGGDLLAVLDVHVHPYWFLLLMLGMQILALMLCFRFIEFNKKVDLKKATKITQGMRRWGILSLTIYSFAIVQNLIRLILNPLTDRNLLLSDGADFLWTVIIIVLDILFWFGVLKLWEKVGYKGSLEWIMLKLAKRGKKYDEDDPLNVKGVLYDVQPVMYVKPIKEQEISYNFPAGESDIKESHADAKSR